ncbi:MAG: hypothetical protein ACRCZG_00030 [Culicoidibacterales bacterium]
MQERNEELVLAFKVVTQTLNSLECALVFEEGRMRMYDARTGKKYDIYKGKTEEYSLLEVK